jgi:hypothetical protein
MVYFAKHADDTDLHRLPLMLFQATICLLPGPSMAGIVKFRRVNQARGGAPGLLAKSAFSWSSRRVSTEPERTRIAGRGIGWYYRVENAGKWYANHPNIPNTGVM